MNENFDDDSNIIVKHSALVKNDSYLEDNMESKMGNIYEKS